MNLTRFALERRTLIQFVTALLLIGGLFSYSQLGRLEDPDFTVKVGVIVTQYPGASPLEVEQEVTDRIEKAIQEMPQLDHLYSFSRAGLSIVRVEMNQEYWADRLPQVWDEMRKKIRDILPQMPPGVGNPEIVDDFSYVYGFVLAVTGDGYDYTELEEYSKHLKTELGLVDGVSRVELWGAQPKVVYVDVSESQLAALGVTDEDILATLASQNMAVSAGGLELPGRRLRIEVTGEFESPEDIGELAIRRSLLDTVASATTQLAPYARAIEQARPAAEIAGGEAARAIGGELIRIKDVAAVRLGYLDPPINQMRFQGEPALAVQVASVAGGNILATGEALNTRLEELVAELPAGIEVHRFAWQSDLVKESIDGFVINLAEAVLIVLVVLTLAMGWRMGVIIGWALTLTIVGTFIFMAMMEIQLHRVSLGALVVALGMMVDNAIVVADGYVVKLKQGMKPMDAAIEAASQPSLSLLGATVVAVMAFYPVFAAVTDGGEYGRTLFLVVGISLMLSWVIALTITPMNCIALLKPDADADAKDESDAYGGVAFRLYRGFLETAIRLRFLTIIGLVVLLGFAVVGFQKVPQMFFPDSTRTQFMVDYWGPEGTPISTVSADLKDIEDRLIGANGVKDVSSFIGSGGPRFYLPVDPELPWPSFGQLVVNTETFADVNRLIADLEPWLDESFPQALVRVRKYTVGPGDTWPFELRVTGPSDADLTTLREIGEQGMAILEASPYAKAVRTDMRNPVQKVVLEYDQERARWAAITRGNIAFATSRAYDGQPVGLFRDGDDMLPIIVRDLDEERERVSGELDVIQVQPGFASQTLPLGQVVQGVELAWEDPIIARWDRKREIAIQAVPDGVTFLSLRADVEDEFKALEESLPPGYSVFWDGEAKSIRETLASLVPGIAPATVLMLLIMVALFNEIRPPIIIILALPFALIGITSVMLPTQTPFGFMAVLGAMSLVGMQIKNAIVLIDEINLNKTRGLGDYDSVVQAGVSRVRPVVLAALTTVLGVVPLIQDVFWISMAMTIMAGLTFGTLVTMVLIPTLYATFYRIPLPGQQGTKGAAAPSRA